MPPLLPPAPRRTLWLRMSLATSGAVMLGLVGIANLPFDAESPLARLFLALAAVFVGGLLAAAFAAFSLACRERRAWLAAACLGLNLIGAACAQPVVNILSPPWVGRKRPMSPRSFVALLLAALAPAAHAALEFSGYTTAREGVRFVVTDLDTKKTSDWLRVGDAFQEHTITGFDARTETLLLERAGASLRLPLKGARITSPSPAPAAAATPGQPRQVTLSVDSAGAISLSSMSPDASSAPVSLRGAPLTDDGLRALFRQLASTEIPIALLLRPPAQPSEPAVAAIKKAMEMLRATGAPNISLTLINATLTEGSTTPPVAVPKPAP